MDDNNTLVFQCESYSKTPKDAAQEFAATYPQKRSVKWLGQNRFKFTDGVATYQIVDVPAKALQMPGRYEIYRL